MGQPDNLLWLPFQQSLTTQPSIFQASAESQEHLHLITKITEHSLPLYIHCSLNDKQSIKG